jgi:hypothetical protein
MNERHSESRSSLRQLLIQPLTSVRFVNRYANGAQHRARGVREAKKLSEMVVKELGLE